MIRCLLRNEALDVDGDDDFEIDPCALSPAPTAMTSGLLSSVADDIPQMDEFLSIVKGTLSLHDKGNYCWLSVYKYIPTQQRASLS